MKYYLLTIGCQMNLSDSGRVRHVIESMGYSETDNEEEAQLLGVIACSVRQKAIDRVYSRIHAWNARKRKENLITFVSGCILDQDHTKFSRLFDIVFPMNRLTGLPELVRTYGTPTPYSIGQAEDPESVKDLWKIRPEYRSSFEAWIPIQNGCDNFCTYCAVPYTRGREISRPAGEILDELALFLKRGFTSLTLLGQNVNSYGKDRLSTNPDGTRGPGFPELLEQVAQKAAHISSETGRKIWIYFTSPHPKDMSDDVIDLIARYPVLARQIHLPVQSGDDGVLKRMNRKYTMEMYRRVADKIRNTLPSATLFTDIIVGFPGETDEEFGHTLQIMREMCYDMAFIARYSPRPGAVSTQWEDDVPHEVKKKRFEMLSRALQEGAEAKNRLYVGNTLDILITGMARTPGYYTAHTEGRINIRVPGNDPSLIGKIVPARVEKAKGLTLAGKLEEHV